MSSVASSLTGTPIINPPQSAILGMHATKMRAVVVRTLACDVLFSASEVLGSTIFTLQVIRGSARRRAPFWACTPLKCAPLW